MADEPCPRARDELVRASRVGVVGVLAQDFIRALAGRPLTDDEQVPGGVEILDQLVTLGANPAMKPARGLNEL